MSPNDILEITCLMCVILTCVVYFVYPLAILILSRLFGRVPQFPNVDERELPSVSLLIAAYNEEWDIEKRILNLLSLNYPLEKLEIVIASDGSDDRTNEIVCKYVSQGIKLFAFPTNRGKTNVLNDSVPKLSGEIIVLSDANTHMAVDAIRRLASWFRDPDIGVVCGRLVLTDPRNGRNVDGLYWKYETFLKKCESRLGALLGSNGAIYAIRHCLFPYVRPETLIDDFVIPLDAKRRTGCRIVYDTKAVASEETAPTIRAEFRRRVRIGAGGFQSIEILWRLLSPQNGWVALTFFFHKILRWLCPFFMIGALLTNAALIGNPYFNWLFIGQVGFYCFAVLGNWIPAKPRWMKFLRLPTMFTSMNLALFFGFFRWLFVRQKGTWVRTDRFEHATPALSSDDSQFPSSIQTAGSGS